MKIIVFVFLLISFRFISMSQSVEVGTVYSNNKLDIIASSNDCNDVKNGIHKEYIFLSFTNKTNKELIVSFYTEVYYNDKCYSCNGKKEFTYTLTIPANTELKGNCSNKQQGLMIFSKMLGGIKAAELTSYSIKDIEIKRK